MTLCFRSYQGVAMQFLGCVEVAIVSSCLKKIYSAFLELLVLSTFIAA